MRARGRSRRRDFISIPFNAEAASSDHLIAEEISSNKPAADALSSDEAASDEAASDILLAEEISSDSHVDVPSSDMETIFNSGSGNYEVPPYNQLVIELWGGGGGSSTFDTDLSIRSPGTAGTASTIASLSLNAGGGQPSTGGRSLAGTGSGSAGTGGIATGGDINTSGNSGLAGSGAVNSFCTGGIGAAAPDGGAQAVGLTDTNPLGSALVNGVVGNAPGGGAAGGANVLSGSSSYWVYGAGSGAKCKKTYNRGDPGAPNPGDILAYVVGQPGQGFVDSDTQSSDGANGATGRVKFTVS